MLARTSTTRMTRLIPEFVCYRLIVAMRRLEQAKKKRRKENTKEENKKTKKNCVVRSRSRLELGLFIGSRQLSDSI
jgi:hypothetical protein